MDQAAQQVERPSRISDVNSMLVSGVVHFSALIVMGLCAAASQPPWGGVKLHVQVGESGDVTAIDDSRLEDVVQLQATDAASAMGPLELADTWALPTSQFADLEALPEVSAVLRGLEGTAWGGRSESEGTARASTEFFGIGGYGQSFVYVVDCSGSMSERGKFDRARYELLHSIEQLASDQRYFVIFFSHDAYPMDSQEMVLATQEHVSRTAEWVGYVEAEGGTNPLPALLLALSLRPDAIYFLSDGQFDQSAIRQLRWRNRPNRRLHIREIPIHTIAFMDRATEYLMRTIARNSGGEYRFVE